MTVSKNSIAILIWALSFVFQALGLEAEPGTLERYAEGILIVAGLLLAIWNQVGREDVNLFFLKK